VCFSLRMVFSLICLVPGLVRFHFPYPGLQPGVKAAPRTKRL